MGEAGERAAESDPLCGCGHRRAAHARGFGDHRLACYATKQPGGGSCPCLRFHAPYAAPARKDDASKARWDLLPWRAVEDLARVMTYEAQEHGPDGWRRVPDGRRRYFAATMRHLVAHERGERADPESGLPHLAHALACVAFLLEMGP